MPACAAIGAETAAATARAIIFLFIVVLSKKVVKTIYLIKDRNPDAAFAAELFIGFLSSSSKPFWRKNHISRHFVAK
jgi:hypothetical protein